MCRVRREKINKTQEIIENVRLAIILELKRSILISMGSYNGDSLKLLLAMTFCLFYFLKIGVQHVIHSIFIFYFLFFKKEIGRATAYEHLDFLLFKVMRAGLSS
jgi:formate/nitrite transporter FocA (FNT family)